MFAYELFKVIYSPFKAFREIIQNPTYLGPILVMLLFIGANAGSVYVFLSKAYIEQTLPEAPRLDEWTEIETLWDPTPKVNFTDYIRGSYYGNRSLEFSIFDDTSLEMQLRNIGSISCSDVDGYKNMSFRVKLLCPDSTRLKSASLFLYSSPADYFYYKLTEHLVPLNTTIWNNLTIPVGPESLDWSKNFTEADWGNISKIGFGFKWVENVNATVRLDGLFFRGIFEPELKQAASYILNFSVSAFMQFTIKWVMLSGLLYVLSKVLKSEISWKPLLIVVGFALITLFIQGVLNTGAYATLPRIDYPVEYFSGVKGESEVAYTSIFEQTRLALQISDYVRIGISIWTVALCAIILRLLAEFSWTKGILVSALAYSISTLVEVFLV